MVITMIDTQYKIKSKKFDIFPFINSVIMILFGPGKTTVIVGLFLYSLLPIVLNTYAGL